MTYYAIAVYDVIYETTTLIGPFDDQDKAERLAEHEREQFEHLRPKLHISVLAMEKP